MLMNNVYTVQLRFYFIIIFKLQKMIIPQPKVYIFTLRKKFSIFSCYALNLPLVNMRKNSNKLLCIAMFLFFSAFFFFGKWLAAEHENVFILFFSSPHSNLFYKGTIFKEQRWLCKYFMTWPIVEFIGIVCKVNNLKFLPMQKKKANGISSSIINF